MNAFSAFFSSPLAESVQFFSGGQLSFSCQGILSSTDVSESLGHAMTLETEQVLLYIDSANCCKINRGDEVLFNEKKYQILAVHVSDGTGEIHLCPI